jgi:hypothetical protein
MAIVTAAELATYTGTKTADAARLALFEIYIGAAVQAVNDYLGYDPTSQAYTHVLDADGSELLQLRARPVTIITAVTRQGAAVDPAALFADREFLAYLDGVTCWPNAARSVIVQYTAGWDAVGMPAAIKLAVLQIAALKLSEENGNLAVTSKSFGDAGTRTFQNTTAYGKFLAALDNLRLLRC